MKVMPIGRMSSVKALVAPVAVAASAEEPRCATSSASDRPTTVWLARESTMGNANTSRVRSVARV